VLLACGLLVAVPLMAAAQSEPDPTLTEVVDPNGPTVDLTAPTIDPTVATIEPTVATTHTITARSVESPFANVSVADIGPLVDEALPQATPAAREKLPPGPPSRWP
jgi:hypothetical protein